MSLRPCLIDRLTRSDLIKRLLLEHDRPEFHEWLNRAYPLATRDAGATWVSLDAEGQVDAQMSAFHAEFWLGDEIATSVLLCNLMVDKTNRTILPVVTRVQAGGAAGWTTRERRETP